MLRNQQTLDQHLSGQWQELLGKLRGANKIIRQELSPVRITGELVRLAGMTMEAKGCQLDTGQRCLVKGRGGSKVEAEVVGFDQQHLFLMPIEYTDGLGPGDTVIPLGRDTSVPVGPGLLGRVVNGVASPLDGKGPLQCDNHIRLHAPSINPLERCPVRQPLDVGIRSINGLFTVGCGQRLGLFSPSGVGKSTLLGMMTRNTTADVIIVAMIGERGREVREFVETILGEQNLGKAVVVAAPADHAPVMRLRAALLAHRFAEYFRDQGLHVLLLMDSLTRYAQAQREIALAVGEPPSARGYPPSAFSMLSRLVERAGNGRDNSGSVSAFYTVLVEGEDSEDPVAESARAILDGHIVLSHEQAISGLYPAVDVSRSVSRTMPACVDKESFWLASRFRYLYERARTGRELTMLGAYQKGNDLEIDKALAFEDRMRSFLKQDMSERFSLQDSQNSLQELLNDTNSKAQPKPSAAPQTASQTAETSA
ncbi:FliI/YscN family ATPase [Sansalvadorimonas sp. 2012CJ34-2]|uniref:Flagellum-specific ATP synthase n=1 Tax=Parendozoicomonas callyspongiae TaxID=2942213 RepID=A0ABT0PDW2_9GAMM|nr:FliI/YscN family ATPase [Sansalvadorimonas sp. 2012CJ34-2]MCL6269544.1 FliI/YscN family ATPase [Sansalvadorimonas sp. 2012CJ34-2]